MVRPYDQGRWQTLPARVPTLRIWGVATLSAASANTVN